jgi:NADH-quinone oxidoreductase subunit N
MNYGELFRVMLPEMTLEIAALVVLLVDLAFLRKEALKVRTAVAAILGVVGCGVAIILLGQTVGTSFSFGSDLMLTGGGIATVAQTGILVLSAVTLFLLFDSKFTRHPGEYVAVLLMAASGGLIIAAAQDLLVIFAGLELLSIALYILTAFDKTSTKSAEGALKYYLYGGMSAAFLLFGFSYLYGLSGSTSLNAIQVALVRQGPSPLLYAAWIFVVAGLGFKIAVVPFHLWAPDAYEGAPAPTAAFIASASKVASFALLLTFFSGRLTFHSPIGNSENELARQLNFYSGAWTRLIAIMLIVAAVSMAVGNLAALAQTSVRRLLAYSAIAHAGYILLGVCALPHFIGPPGTQWEQAIGLESFARFSAMRNEAVLYYILTYGLTVIGAFGVVGVVERAMGNDKLEAFLGLHKRNPVLAAVLLILFLSLAGIPPLVGFWAKFNLFAAVLAVGGGVWPFALVALAVAMSAVSLYYYLQVLKRAYVMSAADETRIEVHPVTLAVLVAIAAAVVLAGCFPAVLQSWIASF